MGGRGVHVWERVIGGWTGDGRVCVVSSRPRAADCLRYHLRITNMQRKKYVYFGFIKITS